MYIRDATKKIIQKWHCFSERILPLLCNNVWTQTFILLNRFSQRFRNSFSVTQHATPGVKGLWEILREEDRETSTELFWKQI